MTFEPWYWDDTVLEEADGHTVDPTLSARLLAALTELDGRARITSLVRTEEEQAELYDRYINHAGPLAAYPGTSNHERGLAVDINPMPSGCSWDELDEVCRRHGLYRPPGTRATENWHYEADPSWVAPPAPIPEPEAPEMIHLIVDDDPSYPENVHLVFTGDTVSWLANAQALTILDKAGVKTVHTTVAQVDALLQSIPAVGPSPSTAQPPSAIAW